MQNERGRIEFYLTGEGSHKFLAEALETLREAAAEHGFLLNSALCSLMTDADDKEKENKK